MKPRAFFARRVLGGLLFLVGCCWGDWHAARAEDRPPAPWISDLGDGTYKNPVIFADYSDPDVIRVGEDFYLTASSFHCVPGLPILHSKDLVNWELIGHAVQRLPERFDVPQHSKGIWAPSIRYHDGWFWIFVGDPDWGILMTKARKPEGPWSPLHVVREGKGLIDTCPLWDDDGQAYLVHAFAGSRAGISSVLTVHRMSPDGARLLDDGAMVFDGRNGVQPTLEGPKFYKRNGWYYILAPAGGVKTGWQLALRAKTPLGPYEAKKVMEQGASAINGPHQGGWVELANGENWFMHFQDRGAYGRIVHLNPVRWENDWPLMGVDRDGNGVGEPVEAYKKPGVKEAGSVVAPATSDEFNVAPGLQWQWQANPQPGWQSSQARPGWLRLEARPPQPPGASNLWLTPNMLLQKFPAPEFEATTKLELDSKAPGTAAGLIVTGNDYAALLLSRTADGFELRHTVCRDASRGGAEKIEATAAVRGGLIWLRVAVRPEGLCVFSYSLDGETFTPLGDAFAARPQLWVGAKVGLLCIGGEGRADVDWFRVR